MVEGKAGLLIPPWGLCKDNEPVRILESMVRKEGEEGKRGRKRERRFILLGEFVQVIREPEKSYKKPFAIHKVDTQGCQWHGSLQVLKPGAVEMGVIVLS